MIEMKGKNKIEGWVNIKEQKPLDQGLFQSSDQKYDQ